jgi:hypothetical protein
MIAGRLHVARLLRPSLVRVRDGMGQILFGFACSTASLLMIWALLRVNSRGR